MISVGDIVCVSYGVYHSLLQLPLIGAPIGVIRLGDIFCIFFSFPLSCMLYKL